MPYFFLMISGVWMTANNVNRPRRIHRHLEQSPVVSLCSIRDPIGLSALEMLLTLRKHQKWRGVVGSLLVRALKQLLEELLLLSLQLSRVSSCQHNQCIILASGIQREHRYGTQVRPLYSKSLLICLQPLFFSIFRFTSSSSTFNLLGTGQVF